MVRSGHLDNVSRQSVMVPRPPSPTKGGAFRIFRTKPSSTTTNTTSSGPGHPTNTTSNSATSLNHPSTTVPYPRQQGLLLLNTLPDFPQVYGSSRNLPQAETRSYSAARRRSNSPALALEAGGLGGSSSTGSIEKSSREQDAMLGGWASTLPAQLPSGKKAKEPLKEMPPRQPWSPLVHMECLVAGLQLQLRADALLLSAEHWPNSGSGVHSSNFAQCTTTLLSALDFLADFVNKLQRLLNGSVRPKSQDLTECVRGVSSRTTALIELSHEAVLALCPPASQPAIINRTDLLSASDQVDVAIFRITQHLEDLREEEYLEESGEFVLWSCGQLSTALTGLVVLCRPAANQPPSQQSSAAQCRSAATAQPPAPRESQLVCLCVAGVQATSQALLAGLSDWLRTVVGDAGGLDLVNRGSARRRVRSMAQSVQASVKALVNIALERDFVGDPVHLPTSAKSVRNSICGSCLTLSSSCIQLLSSADRLYRSEISGIKDNTILQRFSACLHAVNEASAQFKQALTILQGAV